MCLKLIIRYFLFFCWTRISLFSTPNILNIFFFAFWETIVYCLFQKTGDKGHAEKREMWEELGDFSGSQGRMDFVEENVNFIK